MSYRFLPDVTRADLAFEVRAGSFEDLICEASEALLAAMLDDPGKLGETERRDVCIEAPDRALLLYRALEEILFLRDAEGVLLRYVHGKQEKNGENGIRLRLKAVGESVDALEGEFRAEVKAITFHSLDVETLSDGTWRAAVVVDV